MDREKKKLSLAFRELIEIPIDVLERVKYAEVIDVSYNRLSDVYPLFSAKDLKHLILDGNEITDRSRIPHFEKLETLSLNRNRIGNLALFLETLVLSTPNLKHLSLLNNQCCPNFFNGGKPSEYNDYRQYVISRLPMLEYLDDSRVTEEEQMEATRIYGTLRQGLSVKSTETSKKAETTRIELLMDEERRKAEERARQEIEERRAEQKRYLINRSHQYRRIIAPQNNLTKQDKKVSESEVMQEEPAQNSDEIVTENEEVEKTAPIPDSENSESRINLLSIGDLDIMRVLSVKSEKEQTTLGEAEKKRDDQSDSFSDETDSLDEEEDDDDNWD